MDLGKEGGVWSRFFFFHFIGIGKVSTEADEMLWSMYGFRKCMR